MAEQPQLAVILRQTALMLRLPVSTVGTALHFLHKYKGSKDAPNVVLTGEELVTACLFTACKVDEVGVSTNHLINTVHYMCWSRKSSIGQLNREAAAAAAAGEHGWPGATSQPSQAANDDVRGYGSSSSASVGGAAWQQDGAGAVHSSEQFIPLVSERYYAAKRALINAEQVLLRAVRFDVDFDVPHKYLLHYCQTLQLSQRRSWAAVSLLNDALTLAPISVDHSAECIAAGVLHVVLLMLDWRPPAGVAELQQLWPLLGLQGPLQDRVLAVAERVAELL